MAAIEEWRSALLNDESNKSDAMANLQSIVETDELVKKVGQSEVDRILGEFGRWWDENEEYGGKGRGNGPNGGNAGGFGGARQDGRNRRQPTWRERTINARDLCDQRFPDVKHLIPDLVPEGVFLLVSRPKFGKSWWLMQTASAVALGNRIFAADNVEVVPICGDVLHLALEDSDRRIQRRMTKHFGAIRDNWPERMTIATTWRRADQGGLDDIRQWCRSVPNPTLVTVDTLQKFRPRKKPKDDPYASDYAAFEGLVELAHEFPGLTTMVAHHDRKMDADDVFDTVSGTLGLTGGVDTVGVFKSAANGQRSLHVRGRDLEQDVEKAFRFDRETGRWVMLGDAAEVLRSQTRGAVIEVLKRAGKSGMAVADVADDVEFPSSDAAKQVLKRMADAGDIVRVKRGRYAAA
jgi:hypothetical protein